MTHLAHDQLHDLVDGRLSPARHEAVQAHLADCAVCAERVARLRKLTEDARGMPRSIDPGVDLWPGIQQEIEARKVVPLHQESTNAVRRWRRWARGIAAGLAIAIASSLVTLLITRERQNVPNGMAAPDAAAPAAIAAVITRYESRTTELLAAFEAQRETLDPVAIDQIERNLEIIDRALAETKSMLDNRGDDGTLREMLELTYRRKVALLELAAKASL
jgi:anti-sigma factor RsiW